MDLNNTIDDIKETKVSQVLEYIETEEFDENLYIKNFRWRSHSEGDLSVPRESCELCKGNLQKRYSKDW